MTPETDANLSRAWSRWLVARSEVGTDEWRKAALNELYEAVMRAMDESGNGVEWAGALVPLV
jgi:hypothetical protein